MKRILFAFLLLFSTATSFAQLGNLPLEFNIDVGGSYFRAPNLYSAISEAGATQLSNFAANTTFGIGYNFKHVTLGINAGFSHGFARRDNYFFSSLATIYLSTNALRFGNTIFSPLIGFGPQSTRAVITREDLTGTFEDFLTTQSNQTHLSHVVPALDLAIALKTVNPETGRIAPQVKVGYQLGLTNQPWKLVRGTATNAPTDRTGTVYVQISYGIAK